jgi:hypothetical protein
MKRHVIVGRFGVLDKVAVPSAQDEVRTDFDLVASERRLAHGLGQAIDDLSGLGLVPSETGLDVAIVASMVYAADTRISRSSSSQDSWTREIRLVIPVREPKRWSPLSERLTRMLNFLTGDKWTLGFRARPAAFAQTLPPARLSAAGGGVSLFSGGLDSLIGAIDSLERGHSPIFVSHAGEGASSDAQRACFHHLEKQYARLAPRRLRVWMSLPEGLVADTPSENTSRGRSFLFIGLGILAATALTPPMVLRVPENGFISLNVPLDLLRLGSLSTRTTHPFYMQEWNELLRGLGIDCGLDNPYWSRTKGEMVSECSNQDLLRTVAPESLSCASPAKGRWQGLSLGHCGYCVPCIIRRAAIAHAWGPTHDPTNYALPQLGKRPLDSLQAQGKHVRSFQLSAARVRETPALASLLIHKPGPLNTDPKTLDTLARVYRAGLAEVDALLKGVTTKPAV